MSEILNSYADTAVEEKIEAKISSLDSRVSALESGGSGGEYIPLPADPTEGDVLTFDGSSWDGAAPSGGASILVCTMNSQTLLLDKTWKEIKDALAAGTPVFVNFGEGQSSTEYNMSPVFGVSSDDNYYYVWPLMRNGSVIGLYELYTESENGYPSGD